MKIFAVGFSDLSGQKGTSGGVVHLLETCKALQSLGNDLTLFVSSPGKYDGGDLPFKVVYLPYVDIRFIRSLMQPIFLFWWLLILSLRKKPDLIYENCVAYSFSGGLVSRLLGIKHCMHVHGFYPEEMAMAGHGKLRIAIIKFFEWMDYHLTDALFCVTPVNKKKVEKLYKIKKGIAHFVYNGVDADRCRPMPKKDVAEKLGYDQDKMYVGFTGYLFPWSGVDQLIKVAPEVIKECPDARFLIVGNGLWGEKELPLLAKDKGVDDFFIFAGYQPWEKIPLFSSLYDVGVTPYPAERGVGRFRSSMKSLEYSAAATPVVITHCEGVSDIVENGNCGLVVPPDDDKALGEAIVKLLKNENLRKRLGENGRKLVENGYTWRHVAENMMRIVKN